MNKKRVLLSVGIFLFFSTLIAFINMTSSSLNYDILWCFHGSQKVANGAIMYKEISTVVAPIYFWIGGLFIKIFGDSIIATDIYAGVVSGAIATILFNIIKETSKEENKYETPVFLFCTIITICQIAITNYNTLAFAFVLLAAFLEVRKESKKEQKALTNKKENWMNFFIGFSLGLTFMTKQNVGAFGVIATGLYSLVYKCFIKKENTLKEILFKIAGFWSVLLAIICYFLATNAFTEFFDFCFLGLFDFGSENFVFAVPRGCYMLIIIIFLAICMMKDKIIRDDVFVLEFLYMICLMLIIYPIANQYHVDLALFMMLVVLFRIFSKIAKNSKLLTILTLAFVIFYRYCAYMSRASYDFLIEFEKTVLGEPSIIYSLINIFAAFFIVVYALAIIWDMKKTLTAMIVFFALISLESGLLIIEQNFAAEEISENLKIYANHGYPKETLDYIDNVIQYILDKEKEGYDVRVVSADASYYMAALDRNQYIFDLTLNGCLGSSGEEGLIAALEELQNPLILKTNELMYQEPVEFDQYVKNEYEAIDVLEKMTVYVKVR